MTAADEIRNLIEHTTIGTHRRRVPEEVKLAGVEPLAYLGQAAGRAIRNSGTVTLARDLK